MSTNPQDPQDKPATWDELYEIAKADADKDTWDDSDWELFEEKKEEPKPIDPAIADMAFGMTPEELQDRIDWLFSETTGSPGA